MLRGHPSAFNVDFSRLLDENVGERRAREIVHPGDGRDGELRDRSIWNVVKGETCKCVLEPAGDKVGAPE